MAKRQRSKPPKRTKPDAAAPVPVWRHRSIPLLAILMVAAILRLAWLGQVAPPGLNQDEAANAWNAYCLLKTGQDQAGVRWPIFYSRCLGANRSTLQLYVLLPFQALGGLNVLTTRLPSAIGGVLTVLLTYVVGRRLFGRGVGLVAAGLLAVNPWHLQQSRWGHEGALCTLLVMAPLAALLWANLPFDGGRDDKRPTRLWIAGFAGLLTGVCCYGYPAVRLFLPLFLVLAAAVTWRGWWRRVKTRNGALAIGVLAATVAVTFGPLAWQHLTDTDKTGIAKRSRAMMVWPPDASFGEKVSAVLRRYPGHFGPDFLFINGDHYEIQSVPEFGQFHWYLLPMMVLGLGVMVQRLWSSWPARVLLVWLLTYPVSDCLAAHRVTQELSMHALRASPGMACLILLAALGLVTAANWLWQRQRPVTLALSGLLAVAVVGLNVRFLRTFFGEYNRRPRVYHLGYHVDLVEACDWLRPDLADADAVFCTARSMNLPYVVTLVALGYDPVRWFEDERDVRTPGEWDMVLRYGKMHFMYGRSWLPAFQALRQNGRPDRVIFILRPGEMKLGNPVCRINGYDRRPTLMIYRCTL